MCVGFCHPFGQHIHLLGPYLGCTRSRAPYYMISVFGLATARALVVFLVLPFHESHAYPAVVGGMLGDPSLVSWFEGVGVFRRHFRIYVVGRCVGESTEPDPFGRCNGIMYEFVQVLLIGIDYLGGATPQCPAL